MVSWARTGRDRGARRRATGLELPGIVQLVEGVALPFPSEDHFAILLAFLKAQDKVVVPFGDIEEALVVESCERRDLYKT